jgi:hypothetical protein
MQIKKQFETGVHNISNDDYHNSSGVSRSQLMRLKKSPLHYWHEYLNPVYVKPGPSDAMIFGSALHTLVLEPEKFEHEYHVSEKIDRRTTAGKERHAAMLLEHGEKQLLTEETFIQLYSIYRSIKKHSLASQCLKHIKIEQSLYWIDKDTGIECKARPDAWASNMVIDLKSTDDASFSAFRMSSYKYGYHIQAAMIQEGIRHTTGQLIEDFLFLVAEKKAPFPVVLYPLDKEAIAHGLIEFKQLLHKLKQCQDKNEWPGYESQFITIPNFVKFEVTE